MTKCTHQFIYTTKNTYKKVMNRMETLLYSTILFNRNNHDISNSPNSLCSLREKTIFKHHMTTQHTTAKSTQTTVRSRISDQQKTNTKIIPLLIGKIKHSLRLTASYYTSAQGTMPAQPSKSNMCREGKKSRVIIVPRIKGQLSQSGSQLVDYC
jgi:sugar diacid utilization regulator